jgi:hypothetical protein
LEEQVNDAQVSIAHGAQKRREARLAAGVDMCLVHKKALRYGLQSKKVKQKKCANSK